MKDYSLGRAIFILSGSNGGEKNTELFFAGGDYEYKKHYGSIEETLYDCNINVADLDFTKLIEEHTLMGRIKILLKEHLSKETVELLKRLRDVFKRKKNNG